MLLGQPGYYIHNKLPYYARRVNNKLTMFHAEASIPSTEPIFRNSQNRPSRFKFTFGSTKNLDSHIFE